MFLSRKRKRNTDTDLDIVYLAGRACFERHLSEPASRRAFEAIVRVCGQRSATAIQKRRPQGAWFSKPPFQAPPYYYFHKGDIVMSLF